MSTWGGSARVVSASGLDTLSFHTHELQGAYFFLVRVVQLLVLEACLFAHLPSLSVKDIKSLSAYVSPGSSV
jgi:hypothetical protein